MLQSDTQPLLAVFEDLHWVDPTTLELLDMMLDAIADQPIMILATARPTFEHGFGGHPIVTRFALNRLGKDQIGDIVAISPCEQIQQVQALYTNGGPVESHVVKDVTKKGAMIETDDRWYPGTIVDMTLRYDE